jgi:hypothetical protein
MVLPLVVAGATGLPQGPVGDVQAKKISGALPRTDPEAAEWSAAREYVAVMLLQDQAEPKLAKPTVETVRVRALHDGAWLALRLEWDDEARDDLEGPARFADAVALELPFAAGSDVPDAAMGQVGKPVRLTLWRASWQARLEGRKDPVKALYPRVATDHYPADAAKEAERPDMEKLYAPARGAKNPVTLLRDDSPTQDLVAEGFGTSQPAPAQVSVGKGVHKDGKWRVTIAVPLDKGPKDALRAGARTYLALAVWDGGRGNVGARKMRSGWVPLALGAQ